MFTAGSDAPYTVGFSYPGINNQIMTGSPDYGARILVAGDPGKGCSSDYGAQFNTAAFQGPPAGSNGLESGQNYMRGCPDHVWDFAIARNIRLGGRRDVQLRVDMFNAFNSVVINGRNTNAQFSSLQDNTTITNLPYRRGRQPAARAVPAGRRRIRRRDRRPRCAAFRGRFASSSRSKSLP